MHTKTDLREKRAQRSSASEERVLNNTFHENQTTAKFQKYYLQQRSQSSFGSRNKAQAPSTTKKTIKARNQPWLSPWGSPQDLPTLVFQNFLNFWNSVHHSSPTSSLCSFLHGRPYLKCMALPPEPVLQQRLLVDFDQKMS